MKNDEFCCKLHEFCSKIHEFCIKVVRFVQPIFLFWAPHAVHTPYEAPKTFMERCDFPLKRLISYLND